MSKQFTKVLLFVSLVITLSACGGNSGFDIVIKENIEVEYGEELDHTILYDVEKSEKDLTVKEVKDFDSMKIGEQEITVTFALGDDVQDQKVKINVKDTKAPEITFKKETIEITLGDEIDTTSNIESVKDPVDGDIKKSDDNTITQDGYYTVADIKSEAGEYTVTVIAFDKSGNKAERTYKLIIKEKQAESENQPVSSNQGGSSQAPTQNGGTQSQVPASNGSNASSSQPSQSQPQPSQPEQSCDGIHPNAMGEGGLLFDSPEEAKAWANAYIEKDDESGAGNIVNYNYGQAFDMCGNPVNKYVVYFNYAK